MSKVVVCSCKEATAAFQSQVVSTLLLQLSKTYHTCLQAAVPFSYGDDSELYCLQTLKTDNWHCAGSSHWQMSEDFLGDVKLQEPLQWRAH